MPAWQQNVKRIFDIATSFFLLMLLLPVYIIIAIIIKVTSRRGPVFFMQERIGFHGHPFNIIKFRSMYVGAENGVPQLSSERCTHY